MKSANAAARRRDWTAALALGAPLLVVYGVLCWAPTLFDERVYVFFNPVVAGPWPGLHEFVRISSWGTAASEPPFIFLLHWLLYRVGGEHVLFYRLTSLALHAANVFLLLGLYRRLLGREGLALAATALFALFPLHVEVLAISTFKTHLLTAFFALAVLRLLEWDRGGARRLAASWLALLAALFCKESAVVIPGLALLVDAMGPGGLREVRRRRAVLHGGLWAVTAVFMALRLGLAPPRELLTPHSERNGLPALWTALKCGLWAAGHLLWPFAPAIEHDLTAAAGAWPVLPAAAAALAALWALWRYDRVAGLAGAWAAFALTPVLLLARFQNFSLMSDRYLYLSSAGFFLAVGRVASRAEPKKGPDGRAATALTALAVAFAFAASRYAALFLDPIAVWENAVRVSPGNALAHAALGAERMEKGQFEAAAADLRAAVAVDPSYEAPYIDLATADARLGRFDEALAAARRRLDLQPDAPGFQILGETLLRASRPAMAVEALAHAAVLAPDDASIALDLGYAHLTAGDRAAARAAFARAAQDPRLTGPARTALAGMDAAGR